MKDKFKGISKTEAMIYHVEQCKKNSLALLLDSESSCIFIQGQHRKIIEGNLKIIYDGMEHEVIIKDGKSSEEATLLIDRASKHDTKLRFLHLNSNNAVIAEDGENASLRGYAIFQKNPNTEFLFVCAFATDSKCGEVVLMDDRTSISLIDLLFRIK